MDQQHIDELLQRYLGLLDEYTTLRQQLSRIQTGMFQNIARANFSGERGMRYGQDHYDERMQAARRLAVEVDDKQQVRFAVVDAEEAADEVEEKTKAKDEIGEEGEDKAEAKEETDKEGDEEGKKSASIKPKKNPLHWFGLFAPMPLRTAQTQSIQAVEEIIPRLVTVNAEMLNLEIEVRRARKRRAKATAAAEKEAEASSKETETRRQTAPVEAS